MLLKLNDTNFNETIAQGVTLVDFYADWCGPCKALAPTVAALAGEYEGKAKIGKLNVDESGQTAGAYGVMSIPTVIVFKDGKPVGKNVGLCAKATLVKLLDAAL